jgi:hypothetical protein
MVSSEDSAWDVPPSIFGTRAGGPTVQRLVLGMDILVPITMKSAAKCDKQCELQNSANHQILEPV